MGTGHAVQQAESLLKGHSEYILVTTADMPLLTGRDPAELVQAQQAHSGPLTLLTATTQDARGFGRVRARRRRAHPGDYRGGPCNAATARHPRAEHQRLLFHRRMAVAGAAAHPLIPQGGILPDRPGGHCGGGWAVHPDHRYPGARRDDRHQHPPAPGRSREHSCASGSTGSGCWQA